MTDRLVPDRPLPPYTYVPGQRPHPFSNPQGHSFGQHPTPTPCEPQAWMTCREYLWGIDLFNVGCFWEAHESWESLWHGAGRKGQDADFFKALIQLAVAGVKVLEGRPDGVVSHARRALELAATLPDPSWGLPLECIRQISAEFCGHPDRVPAGKLMVHIP